MKEDIYENTGLVDTRPTNVKVNDNEENEEIYANQENMERDLPMCHQRSMTPVAEGSSSAKTRCFKPVVWCLTIVCTLSLVAVAWLSVHINNLTLDRDQVQSIYNNLTEDKDQLQTSYKNLTEKQNQIQNRYNSLVREKDQIKSDRDGLKSKISELEKDIQSGWVAFKSSLYYISTNKNKWSESRDDCGQRRAHLVIINNKEEQDFVKSLKYHENAWIGLNDIDKEAEWKWVDGSALDTAFWTYNEPNGKTQENCVVTTYQSNWMDYPCDTKFVWICEKKCCRS